MTNASIVVCLKSGITDMRTRPDRSPRRSTATSTIAAFRPLSWRLPRGRPVTAPKRCHRLHVAVQGLPPHVHHRAPQFVQQQPRRFVPPQPHLPLEQEGRDAPLVGDCQIGRPEPHGEGRLRVVENRPGGQRLIPTRRTLPAPARPGDARTGDTTPRPATRRQVGILRCRIGVAADIAGNDGCDARTLSRWLAETTGARRLLD